MKIIFDDQRGIKKKEELTQSNNTRYIDEAIIGYEYHAILCTPQTTLEALNHHRERVYSTPANKLPVYGYPKNYQGNWLPLFANKKYNTHTTSKEQKELEFLKKFRKVYESDLVQDQKHEIISSLLKEYHGHPLQKLAADWHLWDLMEIPGISDSISKILFIEGIKSKQDVKMASDNALLNISGIGPSRLRQIRAFFSRDIINKLYETKNDDNNKRTPGLVEIKDNCNKKKKIEPVEINISHAQVIHLPKLKYEPSPDPTDSIKQDWDEYNIITRNARLYYNRKKYKKAKEEWLKIYDWYHRDESYNTYLLRTYRKLIDEVLKKKMHNESLLYFEELFEKCANHTYSDIKNYNSIASHLNKLNQNTKLPLKEFNVKVEHDFLIDSEVISFIKESKKPKEFKLEFTGNTSILELKSLSDYISESLPHIEFDDSSVSYKEYDAIKSILNNTYRFRESSHQNAFLSSSKELKIHLYNWDLELLRLFDASSYAEYHTHLRRIEVSSDLSYSLFTIIDKAYLLDSKMNLKSVWQVPCKAGFEKRKIENSSEGNLQVRECLKILDLHDNPTKEEIKSAFRKLIIKWHPDRNPNNPAAEERTRQLIQAYEFLSGEDAQRAFDGINKEDYYWVDLSHITKFEVGGLSVEITFTIGSGEDWIYGAGISDDGSRVYLGCYSGIIYQINQNGKAEKIYFIPKDTFTLRNTNDNYERTNPISYVTEYNGREYILTHWYLYILKDDKIVHFIKNEKGNYKWFKNGFIHLNKKQIILFDVDGNKKGTLSFKSLIKQVCYMNNILLVETTTKAFTFKLNYN